MSILRAAALALLLTSSGAGIEDDAPVIDGAFGEWSDRAEFLDAEGDGGRFDLLSLSAASHASRVFVAFSLDREINLQSTDGLELRCFTGPEGKDPHTTGLVWDFGAKTGYIVSEAGRTQVGQWDIGLLQAPTVSSSRFEVSFLRTTRDGAPVVPDGTAEFALVDRGPAGDRLPDVGSCPVGLSDSPEPEPGPVALEKRSPDHIRILTWNVRFDGLFSRPAPFLRVLRAIDPDVICFQEVWSHTARQAADQVSLAIPDAVWHGAHTTEGLIVSRFPFLESQSIDEAGNYWALVDLPDDAYGVDLSVVSAHPPCCEQEERRQEQLDAVAAWLRELKRPGGRDVPFGTPTVVAGDMNLVGGSEQLATLLQGRIKDEERHGPSFRPDWDETSLRDADPRHAGGRVNYTWRGPEGPFSPGKLDYVVYSDSVLEQGNAFVLATERLSSDVLERYGLRASDTVEASDHLPVVVDLIPTGGPPRREAAE